MSTELLDLDEALTFLEEVAQSPEEVPRATIPQLEKWKRSSPSSPEPQQRVSIRVYTAALVVHLVNTF